MNHTLLLCRYGLLALLFAAAPAALAQTCTTEWTGAMGDRFDQAGNWTAGVPTGLATGCIIASGTYTVSLRDTGESLDTYGIVVVGSEGAGRQTLALINEEGNPAGPPEVRFEQLFIRPNGGLDLYAGAIIDSPIANEGLFRFIAGPIANLDPTTTLTNTTGTVQFDPGARAGIEGRLVNEAGGTVRFVGPDARVVGQVVNRGLITSAGGVDGNYNQIAQTNSPEPTLLNDGGRIEVVDGEFQVSTFNTIRLVGGTYEAAAGARLLLAATTNEMEGTLGGTPAGTVELTIGASGATATGAGAVLDFGGTGLRWSRGGVTGTWRNEGLLLVAGTGAGVSDGGTFTNAGRMEIEASAMSALGAGTIFLNDVGGTVAYTSPSTSVAAGQGAQLVNRGRVVAEAGPAFWSSTDAPAGTPGVLLDGGRLEATGGDLTVSVTGTARYQGGTYVAAAGRTLTLSSTSGEADGTLVGEGDGTFVLYFQGSPTQRPEDEGVLAFGGQGLLLDNTGFTGAWRNTGRVVHRYGIGFSNATFTNEGTSVWPEPHLLSNSTYVNEASGRIEMVRTGGAGGAGPTDAILNRGLLVLLPGSDGVAVAGFETIVTNAAGGEIRAEAGTISFGRLQEEAGARYTGVGTIQPPFGFAVGGTIAPGNAPGEAGTLTWNRPLVAGPTFVLEVDVNGPDAGTGYDRLAVNGNATLGGTAVLRKGPGYAPAVGTVFPGVLQAMAVTDAFAAEDLDQGFGLLLGATAVDAVVVSPVGIEDGPEEGGAVPNAFALGAAYPNPFRETASFTLEIPEASRVVATAYDLLGREVAVLADEPLAAGEYRLAFDARDLPSGVYLVRLVAGNFVTTRRVTLVR